MNDLQKMIYCSAEGEKVTQEKCCLWKTNKLDIYIILLCRYRSV